MKYKNFTVLFTNLKLDYINKIVECGIVSDRMYNYVSAHDIYIKLSAINQARATRKRINVEGMIFDVARKKLKYLDDTFKCFDVVECALHTDNNGEDILAFGTALMFLQGVHSSMVHC